MSIDDWTREIAKKREKEKETDFSCFSFPVILIFLIKGNFAPLILQTLSVRDIVAIKRGKYKK